MPLLWIGYPLLVHAAVVQQLAWLEALAIGYLFFLLFLPAMRSGRWWAFLCVGLASVGAFVFTHSGWGIYFLYLPPVLMHSFMCAIFAQSLRAGRKPIVLAVAEQIRGEIPPNLQVYSRRLTIFWALLFAVMGLLSVILAIFAQPEWWSLFTNIVSYLVVGFVFVAEFVLRRVIAPSPEHAGAREYFRGLLKMDVRRL